MSDLQSRMSALTGGNTASAASLRKLFDVADRPGGGSGRKADPATDLGSQPGLA